MLANGECVEMTQDHTAAREDEKARCRAAGGTVDRKGKTRRAFPIEKEEFTVSGTDWYWLHLVNHGFSLFPILHHPFSATTTLPPTPLVPQDG